MPASTHANSRTKNPIPTHSVSGETVPGISPPCRENPLLNLPVMRIPVSIADTSNAPYRSRATPAPRGPALSPVEESKGLLALRFYSKGPEHIVEGYA